MTTILVRALRDFHFEGMTASKGEIIEVSPVQASILGRAHHVNLSETNLRKPEPTPEPPAPVQARALTAEAPLDPVKPRRRNYRRRDKTAQA